MAPELCERQASKPWTIRDIFVLTLLIALPIAFFSQYHRLVINTVDGVRVPLQNAGLGAIIFASLALGSLTFLFAYWKLNHFRAVCVAIVGLAVIPTFWAFFPGVLEIADLYRPRGVQAKQAQENYEAAALAATAVHRYFSRTSRWPDAWTSLDADLTSAINDGIEFPLHPTANQMPARIGTGHWSPDRIAKFVEVNFDADLDEVAKQDWTSFSAISVKKPAYNMYREQFTELIELVRTQRNTQSGK